MDSNTRKVTIRRDQLEDIYRIAGYIAHLDPLDDVVGLPEDTDKYAYALGLAQAKAEYIQTIIETVSNGKIGDQEKEGEHYAGN